MVDASYASKDRWMSKVQRFGEPWAAMSTDKNTLRGINDVECLATCLMFDRFVGCKLNIKWLWLPLPRGHIERWRLILAEVAGTFKSDKGWDATSLIIHQFWVDSHLSGMSSRNLYRLYLYSLYTWDMPLIWHPSYKNLSGFASCRLLTLQWCKCLSHFAFIRVTEMIEYVMTRMVIFRVVVIIILLLVLIIIIIFFFFFFFAGESSDTNYVFFLKRH